MEPGVCIQTLVVQLTCHIEELFYLTEYVLAKPFQSAVHDFTCSEWIYFHC